MGNDYYSRIKQLNVEHYAGETSYYSAAELRPAEIALLKNLPKGSTILDVGCGSGRFSINAAKMGYKVLGVDITPDAIEVCKARAINEKLEDVQFKVLDITEENPAQKFDYVFCPRFVINAIATDERRRMAVKNMYNSLKPGGSIFIESFNILYMGKGPVTPIISVSKSIARSIKMKLARLFGKEYSGLFPGDITYPANKAAGASEGFAHLPTIFEVESYLKEGKLYSIHQVIGTKKIDFLKPFRYSIWTIERC